MSIDKLLKAIFIISYVCTCAYALQLEKENVSLDYLADSKKLVISVPNVELTTSEKEKLYSGEPIAKLLEGKDGLKMGWLRFFANCDPISAWYIVTDVEHFSLEDPSYPATGPLDKKRRTFMPYTFDCVPCSVDGKMYVYQLIVPPLVSPRKYSLLRHHDRRGFPWQSAWTLADKLYCSDKRNAEFESEFNNAVLVLRNTGSFLVSPLSVEFRRAKKDLNRTDIIYFVDVHPAGDIAKLKPLVNFVQKIGLPDVANNINFHAKSWSEHMKKYHSSAEFEEYKMLYQQYIETYEPLFGKQDATD